MISAAELRKKMTDTVMRTMSDVEVAVKRAADQGMAHTSVTIREGFDYSPVVQELENLGYKVKIKTNNGDWRDQGYRYLEITW